MRIDFISRMDRDNIPEIYQKLFGVHPIIDASAQQALNGFMTWAERYQEEHVL